MAQRVSRVLCCAHVHAICIKRFCWWSSSSTKKSLRLVSSYTASIDQNWLLTHTDTGTHTDTHSHRAAFNFFSSLCGFTHCPYRKQNIKVGNFHCIRVRAYHEWTWPIHPSRVRLVLHLSVAFVYWKTMQSTLGKRRDKEKNRSSQSNQRMSRYKCSHYSVYLHREFRCTRRFLCVHHIPFSFDASVLIAGVRFE